MLSRKPITTEGRPEQFSSLLSENRATKCIGSLTIHIYAYVGENKNFNFHLDNASKWNNLQMSETSDDISGETIFTQMLLQIYLHYTRGEKKKK